MSNAKIPNPYESPQPDRIWSWWDLLRQWFPGLFPQPFAEPPLVQRLLQGKRVFVYGVVLQLPSTDPDVLTAALPLAVVDEERALRNIHEARRVLRKLVKEHPDLQPLVQFRHLVLQHMADYSLTANELRRDVFPPEDWLLSPINDDEWETEIAESSQGTGQLGF